MRPRSIARKWPTRWRSGVKLWPESRVPITREGLTAHYDFDGSSERHLRRVSTRPHAERRSGFGAGQVSGAVAFDGQTLVTLGPVGICKREQPFTIAFWLRYGGSKQPMPSSRRSTLRRRRRGWEMWLDDPCWWTFRSVPRRSRSGLSSQWPSSALELRTRERVTQNEWNHIAVVSDGTGKASGLTLYVNGVTRRDRYPS